MSKFARRCAALMLAVVLLCMAVPAAFAAEGDTLPPVPPPWAVPTLL